MLAALRLRPPRFAFKSTSPRARHASSHGSLLAPPHLKILEGMEDMNVARHWVEHFKKEDVPKSLVDISFSRSSGPGGQNVNKVNTKATLRCSVSASWIPAWARAYLQSTTYYAPNTHSIVLSSTVHRTQSQNVDDCLAKLRALVIEAASKPIRNEPSAQQQARVRGLERAEKARRQNEKIKRSSVKQLRRGKGGGSSHD